MKGKKLWITLLVVIVLGSGAFYFLQGDSSSEEGQEEPFVVAEIGTVVEKALAVGTIEPDNEIEIKSKKLGNLHFHFSYRLIIYLTHTLKLRLH